MSNIILLLIIGLLAGIVSGGLGVGGGIIIIPGLLFLMGFSQHQAQGTSLALMVAPIGLIAAYNYYKAGHVNIKYAAIILVAFFLGSYLGSLVSVNLPGKTLQKVFGILLLITGFKLILTK
jgi:uncharacterized protein